MGKFMSWSYLLRFLIIVVLFTIFVTLFGRPSFNNYLNAGVIIEKNSVKRENKDTPAITFCAMDNETTTGWKKEFSVNFEFGLSWVDMYCNNSKTVKDAVTCLDDVTYNLTETMRDFEHELIRPIGTDNDLWIYDVTEAYIRGLFKGEIQPSIQILTQSTFITFGLRHFLKKTSITFIVYSGK